MKQFVRDNIRIQFLSEDIVRLEAGKKGVFCDGDTMLVANKTAFDGVEITVNEKSDGAYVTHGDITVFVPAEAKNLSGAKLILDGKIAYVYKNLRNSGELPTCLPLPTIRVWLCPKAAMPRIRRKTTAL